MFREYGVDPALIPAWADNILGDFIMKQFGLSRGRLLARVPKDWTSIVRELHDLETNATKKKKIEVLRNHLGSKFVGRSRENFIDTRTWLENAEIDNERVPFRRILSNVNPRGHDNVLVSNSLSGDLFEELSGGTDSTHLVKTTANIVTFLSPILRCATEIKFIDPYFYPAADRYGPTFKALLFASKQDRPGKRINRIEIHVKQDEDHAGTLNGYRTYLPPLVPSGDSVEVFFWEERLPMGLHDRYVLTDLGGFNFAQGLSTSPTPDPVHRLEQTTFNSIVY